MKSEAENMPLSQTGTDDAHMPRFYRWIGHFSFLTILIFSILWMFARVCNIDGAYQIFQMVNSESFSINDGRYGMIVSQLLPLAAIHCHLPLNIVMMLYSVSFVLLAYLLYLSTLYLLGEERIAFCMVLVFLCMRVTFLHVLSETFQLMFFGMYTYALLAHHLKSKRFAAKFAYYFSILFSVAFCLFIHPVAIFFIPFVILYIFINEGYVFGKELWFASVAMLACIGMKFLLPKQGGHDDQFLLPLPELLKLLPGFFHFGSLKYFVQHFFDFYYLPVILFVWTSVFYLKKRKILKMFFYATYNVGFFLITLWIYHAGDGPIGMERSFLPLLFFCGVPFVVEVLANCKNSVKLAFGIAVFCLLSHSFVRIGIKADSRQQAFANMEKIMRKAEEQQIYKIWLSTDNGNALQIPTDWGIGVSSMLYSSCKFGKENVCNLFVYPDNTDLQAGEIKKSSSFAFVPWWIYRESEELNPVYFELQEGPFCLLRQQDDHLLFSPLNM